jgi:cobalt-zinc-cadmium efflux system outer membrane protein
MSFRSDVRFSGPRLIFFSLLAVTSSPLTAQPTLEQAGPTEQPFGPEAPPPPRGPLTLERVVARALAANPALAASESSISAARFGRIQAGVRPVDQIEIGAENIVGTGGVLNRTEITAAFARTLERGGKREARLSLAEREIGLAEASALVRRLELASNVEQAFASALIADARLLATEDQLETERVLAAEAERRVRGYRDPLFVRTRAQARVAEAEVGVAAARRVRASAYTALAGLIGVAPDRLDLDAVGFLDPVGADSNLAEPDLALAAAEVARAEAAIALARTRATPDYTVRGGLRYTRETDDLGLVGGIVIPFRTGRANAGNVERAQAERERVAFDAEATRLERLRRVTALRGEVDGARLEVESIGETVLPRLEQALAEVRAGYNRGGFSFADIQDQARAMFEARNRLLAALERHHNARVELDRLTGRFANLEIVR